MGALDLPVVLEAEQKVLAGVMPNYAIWHECPVCGERYLCPDRYLANRCEPTAYIQERGWIDNGKFTCLPCAAELSSEERERWYRIHGAVRG